MKAVSIVLTVIMACAAPRGFAQMIKDNTQWSYEAKKKTGNQYELIVHASLEKGWHIYAMKPGGDGSLLGVTMTYDKNSKVVLNGPVKEKGKLTSAVLIPGDPKINMYTGKVDYIQQATVTGPTTVTGTFTYQICNDNTCLPPVTKKISIKVQ